jgi:hypothetical protein
VRYLDLAEVERHTGYALWNSVRRWEAAQVHGFQCAGLDHKESRLFLWEGKVMIAGAMIIARKTKARIRSLIMVYSMHPLRGAS